MLVYNSIIFRLTLRQTFANEVYKEFLYIIEPNFYTNLHQVLSKLILASSSRKSSKLQILASVNNSGFAQDLRNGQIGLYWSQVYNYLYCKFL